jgi:DNA-binding CsgD family transcriptional regulator
VQASIDRFRVMPPNVRRAVEIDREPHAAYAALERLESGVLLVGVDGYVVHMNAAAAEMIAAKDGLELSRNRLHAARIEPSREMARHIHDAATHCGRRGGTVILPRPSGRRPMVARVYPLSVRACVLPPEGTCAVVFVADPEFRAHEPVSLVARAYDLTTAEARLSARLIYAPTLVDAADGLAITEATARTLLGRIFAKTGTTRQQELVRLVFTTRPPVRPD